MATGQVVSAAEILISYLGDVKSAKPNDSIVSQEVDTFVTSLNNNIDQLQRKLPHPESSWATTSVQTDLTNATSYVENCLKNGYFQELCDANEIKAQLERLRQNLLNAIQVKLLIATLEVVVDPSSKRVLDFHSRMLQLSAANDAGTRSEIRQFLQPLLVNVDKYDEKLPFFNDTARRILADGLVEGSETRKFFEDVLRTVDDLTTAADIAGRESTGDELDDQFYDPITFEMMYDPVKCSDGRTYNRWTIIDNHLKQSPFDQRKGRRFEVEVDDLDVRRRLFDKFPSVEVRFRGRRASYRAEALSLARAGRSAEALAMLDNVLKWADGDAECQRVTEDVARSLGQPRQQLTAYSTWHLPIQASPQDPSRLRTPMTMEERNFVNDNHIHIKHAFGARLFVLICCFPFSLCCITCLMPEVFEPI